MDKIHLESSPASLPAAEREVMAKQSPLLYIHPARTGAMSYTSKDAVTRLPFTETTVC